MWVTWTRMSAVFRAVLRNVPYQDAQGIMIVFREIWNG